MTEQLQFGQPVARRSDPDTSHAAARDARAGAASVRARCLVALRNAGERGLTDFELADEVGSQQTSAGRRRKDLVDLGLVEDSKERRPAPSGSDAIVWRAVPQ